MKKILFFLLLLLVVTIKPIFAQSSQPIFVVSSIDLEYEADGDFVFEGELENSEDRDIYFDDDKKYVHDPIHILYKGQIISIFPLYDLAVRKFFYDLEDSYYPQWLPFSEAYTSEKPAFTFDNISEGAVQSVSKKTGRCRVGKIVDGNITIEYQNRTKTMVIYFSGLKIDWKKK